MKKYIKFLSVPLMAVIMTLCCALPVSAREDAALYADVTLQTENGDFEYAVKWWQPEVPEENKYSLTLPYSVKGGMVSFDFTGADSFTFDGSEISCGENVSSPAQGTHTLVRAGVEYTLTVLYTSDIPAIFIDTDSGSMDAVYADKSYKETGKITVLNGEKVEYSGDLKYIKGRGNSSWSQVKKPFNIKLAEKADLMDMGRQSTWCLLANYVDVSLIKNKIALDFADLVGLEYSSKSEIVDLYINNEYIGNYTLTEKVEIGENRIDITNLEKITEDINPGVNLNDCTLAGVRGEESPTVYGGYKYVEVPKDPRDITGGYLLEYELNYRYDDEASGFVTDYGQPIIVKSPEYASKAQVEYIRGYYQEFEDAVLSDDGCNSKGKHYTDYIEIESMVKMYVFQEYVKNLDAGRTSFYLYKDVDGKFVASPVWDFDMAMGHLYKLNDIELSDAYGYLATGRRIDNGNGYTILSLLARRPEFREMAAREWENNFAPKVDSLIESIDSLAVSVRDSALADKNKWTEGFIRSTAEVAQWHDDKVTEFKNFMKMRAGFMDYAFSTDNIYVAYYANGGKKAMLETDVFRPGDTVEIMNNKFTYGNREFLGWNTEPDGSGTAYSEDDEVVLEDTLVLYAQWSELSFIEKIQEFFSGLFG